MQRPSHSVYGPNTLFDPTNWLQRRLDQLGITLPEVLAMLPLGRRLAQPRCQAW